MDIEKNLNATGALLRSYFDDRCRMEINKQ